ncbi:unnamed protein product [Prorocentrum cordatum]|uniref:Uncharacterized protein n=1 Tax=Prorocentrum cordatum TaxID=2364126 RepID=A0ABN9QZL6_9DINO|nr:unnamed protein product [Polarella glacialis]
MSGPPRMTTGGAPGATFTGQLHTQLRGAREAAAAAAAEEGMVAERERERKNRSRGLSPIQKRSTQDGNRFEASLLQICSLQLCRKTDAKYQRTSIRVCQERQHAGAGERARERDEGLPVEKRPSSPRRDHTVQATALVASLCCAS